MRPPIVFCLCLALAACSNAAEPSTDAPLSTIDARSSNDGSTTDAPRAPRTLVINEVAAGEAPDWFEIVNVSAAAVELADFKFIDSGGVAAAVPFAAMTLAPNAYFVQDVDDSVAVPFKLAGDEELHLYQVSDDALVDTVDWAEGAAAVGTSYARSPDATGAFATTATPSKGVANP